MADIQDRRPQVQDHDHEDTLEVRELKWTVGDLEQDKQPKPDSSTKVYPVHINGDKRGLPMREQKPLAFLSALRFLKAPYGKQAKMVEANLESSDDDDDEEDAEDADIQLKTVPPKKEDQISHQMFKRLKKRVYQKLQTIEEQVKDLNFNSQVSERSHTACETSCPLERDGTASLSDTNEEVQKPRVRFNLPGRACDVAQYVPLESPSSATTEAVDLNKTHRRLLLPRGLTSFTKTMSGLLSKPRAQTEELAVTQQIHPRQEE